MGKAGMNVLQIVPEMEEGGVERHVLGLSNSLAAMGNRVVVVSAGGKLEKNLKDIPCLHLPVHRKNPFTALYAAFRIADCAKREQIRVLHAHSRVPAWIAWWVSRISGIPFVLTAHAMYSHGRALLPFSRASAVISVSDAVRGHLAPYLEGRRSFTILNGLEERAEKWSGRRVGDTVRFLFVGRLTDVKGLHVLLGALEKIRDHPWVLDVVGDGPRRKDLEALASRLDLGKRVVFHGFREDPETWMAECSCFLFPSLEEGMGLTLMRAVSMAVPVIASDLPAVREIALSPHGLVPPGQEEAWAGELRDFLITGTVRARFVPSRIPGMKEMASSVAGVYEEVAG